MKRLLIFLFIIFMAFPCYAWYLPGWHTTLNEIDGPLTINQNLDAWTLTGDDSDWTESWSDGSKIFQTDEGTDTDTTLMMIGKGAGDSIFEFVASGNTSLKGSIACTTEAGLGARVWIGLPNESPVLAIGKQEDIDQDMGDDIYDAPTISIYSSSGSNRLRFRSKSIYSDGDFSTYGYSMGFSITSDRSAAGLGAFLFNSVNNVELIGDNSNYWMELDAKINKATDDDGDAPYQILKIRVTETDIDTAAENYLIDAGLTSTLFAVNRAGALCLYDGITLDGNSTLAQMYIDQADGDLKIRFPDGFVATIIADS